MSTTTSTIIWTQIDEAPALATYSLLPIVQAFTKGTGVSVETRDISLAGRIIANFPDALTEAQRIPDYLTQLGELTHSPEANIIKLPERLGVDPAAEGGHQGTAGEGLQGPGLPGDRERRRREGHPGPVREGARQRREPRAARGQLRPPVAALGEGVLEEAPAQARRVEPGLEGPRRAHDGGRLLRQREFRHDREGDRRPLRVRGRRRHRVRPQEEDGPPRGRDPRHLRDAREAAAQLFRRADRRRESRRACSCRCTSRRR